MNYELQNAMREWSREVENEAARLIKRGIPPYDAMERARNTVSRRRAAKPEERK